MGRAGASTVEHMTSSNVNGKCEALQPSFDAGSMMGHRECALMVATMVALPSPLVPTASVGKPPRQFANAVKMQAVVGWEMLCESQLFAESFLGAVPLS